MITDEERREIADSLRRLADGCHNTGVPDSEILDVLEISYTDIPNCSDAYDVEKLADLIDRPMCHDLVEHKQDPFIPGKRMTDGYFHCSSCGWHGQLWEYIGFGDMLAYEPVHCPKCGEEIKR